MKYADIKSLVEFTRRFLLCKASALVLLLGVATCPAAAETPFCALRFGYVFTDAERWPEMRAALEKNRKAFDEVWFSTGVSFPKMSWHEAHARRCAAAAADLRRMGIVPSIELQTILGHTDAIIETGDVSGQDWQCLMTSCEGRPSKHIACPRDANLRAYFARVAELHAAWHPGSVWVDDDLSFRNRAPVSNPSLALPGCFCDRCLAGFGKSEGHEWSRTDLAAAIRTDCDVRARWNAYSCEGYAGLTRTIAEAVHRISPETVFGYQYGGLLQLAIPKGLFDGGGGRPVRLRPGAGAYWDTDAYQQLDKAYGLQFLLKNVHGEKWIDSVCPEIETCPRTFACRTPQGLVLEAFENLALGMNFISMFAADGRGDESVSFYADRLFPRLAAAHDFLKGYHDVNVGTAPCGLSVKDDRPSRLVACRGIPVVGACGRSLGTLPPVASIKVRTSGSPGATNGPAYETRVMQIASSTGLLDFAVRADAASGGRLPVLFDEATFAFLMPRVKDDLTLVSVALVNCSIDRQDPVGVRLRGVPEMAKVAVWHLPESDPVQLPLAREGSIARVTIPRIGAWECGYLTFR